MKESIKLKNFKEEGEWGGGKVQIGTASHSLILLQSEFLHVHCIENPLRGNSGYGGAWKFPQLGSNTLNKSLK